MIIKYTLSRDFTHESLKGVRNVMMTKMGVSEFSIKNVCREDQSLRRTFMQTTSQSLHPSLYTSDSTSQTLRPSLYMSDKKR